MKYNYLIILVMVAAMAFFYNPTPGFALILDTADNFAVLGSSTVTNTGLSTVNGDLGVDPGSAIVGFDDPGGPGIVNGTIHGPDGVSFQAQNDAHKAWTGLKSMSFTNDFTGIDLGSHTLTAGVYHFDTSAGLTGALILDAQGLDNAFWNFQIGSTLTTASFSSVTLINPGLNNGIFWQIGSSATLGTDTSFMGNLLAEESITLNTNANILCGRALALTGAVTMDNNDISAICGEAASHGLSGGLEFNGKGEVVPISQHPTVVTPEPATLALFGLGLLGLSFRGTNENRKNSGQSFLTDHIS